MRNKGSNTTAVWMAIAILALGAFAAWLANHLQPSEKEEVESSAYEFYNSLHDRGYGAERLRSNGSMLGKDRNLWPKLIQQVSDDTE